MKLDEINNEIIKHLKDGRKSFGKIAEDLSLAENTVRTRVNKMQEEGILKISGLVDPEAIPGHTLVMVGVKLATMEMVEMGEKLSRLRGVVCAGIVTGRFDIILIVLLNEEFGLLEFLTQEVSPYLEDIQSTETFVVYKGLNMSVPYIL